MLSLLKLLIPIIVSLLAVLNAHATVKISSLVIYKKNVIEILGPGPDIQSIIDEISDEGPNKPYLIKLAAGMYQIADKGIQMTPFINISGSGEGITILRGSISTDTISTSSVISGADFSSISELTLINTGKGAYSVAMFNHHASPRIKNVSMYSSGSADNMGVFNSFSSPTLKDVTISITGPADNNYGVFNDDSSPMMNRVTITSHGGKANYGLFHGKGGPIIEASTISGSTASVFGISKEMRLIETRLIGDIVSDAEGIQCRGTYDENLQDVIC